MSNATAIVPVNVNSKLAWCDAMAESRLLPQHYQRRPADLLWAIEFAESVNVHRMTAITGVHVIQGKPCASADLIAALVRRAGHKLRVTGNDTEATAQIVRADDPDFDGFKVTWTMARANAAKLTGKDNWRTFPAAMLRARAVTEVARMACSEVLHGMVYTPEEMGATVDEDGTPVEPMLPAPKPVPLRAVEAEPEPDRAAPNWLALAEQAMSVDAVRDLWADAKKHGADKATLDAIAECGRTKAQQPRQAPPTPAPTSQAVPPQSEAPAASSEPAPPALNPMDDDAVQKAIDWLRAPLCHVMPGEEAAIADLDGLPSDVVLDLYAKLRQRATRSQVQKLTALAREAKVTPTEQRHRLGVASRKWLTREQASAEIDRLQMAVDEVQP